MFLDAATLRDLEALVPTAPNGPTLLGLVDRTRTRIGRERLRHRLMAPSHDPREILDLQRAHQVIAADSTTFRRIIDQAGCDDTEQYLKTNWQLPAEMRGLLPVLGGLGRIGWMQQYLKDVRKGQYCVTALLDAATDLCRTVADTRARVLQDLRQRLDTLISAPSAQELLQLRRRRSVGDLRAFDQLAREGAKPLIVEALEVIGTLEAMWSLTTVSTERGWSYPRPGSRLTTVGLAHPFLDSTQVTNDLDLNDRVHVCFVTGPNMAGKSTFLKAVAIAMLLAHTGCGVPAISMEFPVVETIFSSVHIVDNLSAGESFYLAEVRRIRALASALHEYRSTLAVIDEPFRGTNVHDAAEATVAVMTRLAAHPSALVLLASHIGEVAPVVANDPRIRLLHFAADVTTEPPRFGYRLREGVSLQRLGMTLLRQEQVLDLLERATGSMAAQGEDQSHAPASKRNA